MYICIHIYKYICIYIVFYHDHTHWSTHPCIYRLRITEYIPVRYSVWSKTHRHIGRKWRHHTRSWCRGHCSQGTPRSHTDVSLAAWLRPKRCIWHHSHQYEPTLTLDWLNDEKLNNKWSYWIDGFVQDCSNSSANALELLQSGTYRPIHIYVNIYKVQFHEVSGVTK